MGSIGRNEPCPCGSGKKNKKCCLSKGAVAGYTKADRESALERLLASIHAEDLDDARERFWGEHLPLLDKWSDPALLEMAENAFQFWMFFDELCDGETAADEVVANDPGLGPGERRYLEVGRKSSMRLYEVVGVQPGASLTLRDVLDGREVRVLERAGSRSLHAWDLLAARVMEPGASGAPEIDGGCLPIASTRRDALVDFLLRVRRELDDAELREALPPAFLTAWISPVSPNLVNFDGESILPTKVQFTVSNEAALIAALDHAPDLVRGGDVGAWSWVGKGKDRKEPVTRGFVRLEDGRLVIETNSRERGEAARTLVAKLAGPSAEHRATEHQDIEQAIAASAAAGQTKPPTLPAELAEPAREAVVQMLQQHYERWLDEPVPMFDDETPRRAAGMPELRSRVAGAIEDLERMYERGLVEDQGAFDPTWMWEELGLEDLARGRSRICTVPRLPHEVIGEIEPEIAEAAADIGDRARRASASDVFGVIEPSDVEADLAYHRVVRERVRDASADGEPETIARREGAALAAWIRVLADFELHLRKTFWVDEPLAWMLGATALDVDCDALRPPFTTFALVFTDRYALGVAERLLASDPAARLRGRILAALTVYVTSREVDGGREMRLAIAADAGDGRRPDLLACNLVLRNGASVAEILGTLSPLGDPDELPTIAGSPPLRALTTLVLNAILYATSAEADAVPGDPRGRDAPVPRRRPSGTVPPSDGVFRLPGKIDVGSLRQLKRVRRGASEVQALRRCMVRGHWRRASKSWKDESPRWIKPHWRGPSAAPIVERDYRLK